MSDNPQGTNYGIVSEDYIRGALDCFYGNKDTIGYIEGGAQIQNRVKQCSDFKALYPNFGQNSLG